MNLRLILLLASATLFMTAEGQVNRFYHQNAIFSEDIKSSLHRAGFELSNPVWHYDEDAAWSSSLTTSRKGETVLLYGFALRCRLERKLYPPE